MRRINHLLRLSCLVGLSAVLLACSTGPTYNPTTFPFQINEERLANDDVKTVVIPHVNLNGVTRNYLEAEAPRIDGYVSIYLKEKGYKVLPQRDFQQHWNTAVRAFGPIMPSV